MSITTGVTTTHLTRSTMWTGALKETLQDALDGQGYVNWLSDFPDGSNWTIPSIGEATVRDYSENNAATYDSLDTGQFQFSISEYKQSGLYITEQARQDSWYSAQLEASFVPKMQRALAENVESDIFSVGQPTARTGKSWGHGQTSGDDNTINGVGHRYVGTGTSGSLNRQFDFADAAKALHALKRANVPDTNLIGIVDPSVEYYINTQTLQTDVGAAASNPRWEGLVEDGGVAGGMRFVRNIFGFDIYVSNYLSTMNAGETFSGTNSVAGDVANIFFSAAGADINPFVGAWRQMPKVDSDYNKDFQREEYIVTARYGLDFYRPENFVTVLTNPQYT